MNTEQTLTELVSQVLIMNANDMSKTEILQSVPFKTALAALEQEEMTTCGLCLEPVPARLGGHQSCADAAKTDMMEALCD